MSGGAKKAAPREKALKFGDKFYRVTDRQHFINGALQPVGAIVQLPEGIEPGLFLVEVDEDGNEVKAKPAEKEPAKPAK